MSPAPPRRAAPLRPLPPAAAPAVSVLAVLLGALAAGLVVFAWPTPLGVALTGAERAQAARLVASIGGGLGLLGAALARGRSPLSAGLLPLVGLALLAILPVGGRAHVHVGAAWLVIAVTGLIFTLAAARSPLAPALPGALGGFVVLVGLARWVPVTPASTPTAVRAGPHVVLIALAGAPADLFDAAPATAGGAPVLHALRAEARVFTGATAPAAGDDAGLHAALSLDRGDAGGARPADLPAALGAQGYERVALLGSRAGVPRGMMGHFDVFDDVFVNRLAVGHPLLRGLGHRPLRPAAAARPARELLRVWQGLPAPRGPRLLVLQLAELRWPLAGKGPRGPLAEEQDRARLEASLRPLLARVPRGALLILFGTAAAAGPTAPPRAPVPLLARGPGLEPGLDPAPLRLEDLGATVLASLARGAADPGLKQPMNQP